MWKQERKVAYAQHNARHYEGGQFASPGSQFLNNGRRNGRRYDDRPVLPSSFDYMYNYDLAALHWENSNENVQKMLDLASKAKRFHMKEARKNYYDKLKGTPGYENLQLSDIRATWESRYQLVRDVGLNVKGIRNDSLKLDRRPTKKQDVIDWVDNSEIITEIDPNFRNQKSYPNKLRAFARKFSLT